jgi:hypothetical protein
MAVEIERKWRLLAEVPTSARPWFVEKHTHPR